MLQGLKQKIVKSSKENNPTRVNQLFLLAFTILFTIILATSYFSKNVPINPGYSADGWAQMSMTIGASVLTLLAILTTIGLSNENVKRLEFNDTLTGLSNRIDEKERNNPDRTFDKLYDSAKEKIQAVIDSVPILRYRDSLLAILSFIFFLLSTFFAIMNAPFAWALFTFTYGAILLVAYVMYVIEEFANMDKYSRPPKKKGTLELLDLRLNDKHQPFQVLNNKVNISTKGILWNLEVTVRITGKIRNGFLHATLKCRNSCISYIPDSNTFLASFGFVDDYRLTLLEKEYDTGILQIDGSTELDFEIPIRVQKNTEDNPLVGNAFVENLGNKQIFKHCSIPIEAQVQSIELRLYEDPLYKPTSKRREVDCITLKITENEQKLALEHVK